MASLMRNLICELIIYTTLKNIINIYYDPTFIIDLNIFLFFLIVFFSLETPDENLNTPLFIQFMK